MSINTTALRPHLAGLLAGATQEAGDRMRVTAIQEHAAAGETAAIVARTAQAAKCTLQLGPSVNDAGKPSAGVGVLAGPGVGVARAPFTSPDIQAHESRGRII
eukprot:12556831-Alexandrium_andersonii.AAC.1